MPTDFAGNFLDFGEHLRLTGSSDVAAADNPWLGSLPISAVTLFGFSSNAGVPQPVITVASRSLGAGQIQQMFGGELFQKIIVTPRLASLSFVISETQFPVEVWNTFTDLIEILESVSITGTGGLTLTDPFGEPLAYAAMDSRIYQAAVPTSGPAQISQDIDFVFAGISGTDCSVTGSRITLFSVAPDWNEGFEESIEALTDVLVAYSDNEQRRALRQIPRRALRFRALTLNARDAAGMESLVWGWQQQPFGIPWWPDAQPLTANVSPGDTTISVNTADRLFAPGGLVCIWQNEYLYEAMSILGVGPNSLTLSSPAQFAWTAGPGTRVIPVMLARMPNKVSIKRYSSEIDQLDLSLLGESQQVAPTPAATLTQYKGFDVLEIPPNWADAPLNRDYDRSLLTLDPKIGVITVIDKGGSAIVGQEFPWWLDTHPNITKFRAFVAARMGRFKPFWLPTWDQDLQLSSNVGSSDGAIVIENVFYTRFFFPTPARRFLAFIPIDGSGNVYRQVTGSVDNGNGTETLTLDSPTGKAFAKSSTMVSFLTFARLGTDSVSIKWDSSEHAEAVLTLQELPRELP